MTTNDSFKTTDFFFVFSNLTQVGQCLSSIPGLLSTYLADIYGQTSFLYPGKVYSIDEQCQLIHGNQIFFIFSLISFHYLSCFILRS